ncbi:hypothetical protein GCM10023081_39370 [Arthrobacter ginkgonis]|uniref:Uncharacterized protein n=1 Tax=Arthrobacter ginkgonis TaxID=1630594 RepID=A0ABP7D2J8_9MICC
MTPCARSSRNRRDARRFVETLWHAIGNLFLEAGRWGGSGEDVLDKGLELGPVGLGLALKKGSQDRGKIGVVRWL